MAEGSAPILIVDDDGAYREMVADALARAGYTAVQAGDGQKGLELARSQTVALALIDIKLPVLSGYALCSELRAEQPELPIIFVSGERTEAYDRVAGLLIGADDYLVKPIDSGELVARVTTLLRRAGRSARRRAPGLDRLTVREREVLHLLADGISQKAIATRLVISDKTVGTHIQHVLTKLGVHNRAQAVAVALRAGAR